MSAPRAGSDSLDCPDLLQDVQHLTSPTTPLIATGLRLRAAAEPSPGPGVLSGLQPGPARPSACTPLPSRATGGSQTRGRATARSLLPLSRPQRSPGIPIMASRLSLQPSEKVIPSKRFCLNKGSATQELVHNRIQELKENSESKERLVAASIVLGADVNDQTWVCAKSSLFSELAPGLTSGCEDTVPAEQSASDQLCKELKCVKQELEQVKGELADKTAQCKTYQQTISFLEAQLRAADMHFACSVPLWLPAVGLCYWIGALDYGNEEQ
ncbi:hypothetical protein RLOC_00004949 [Lonchura striata]|uniref:Uncharacterized protein n=1 Tax=Lonchura striata TaxID=40157 RepID=A0A218UKM0_9PASE|nr:hypothetical protein RLOC_00004949 [Lonchura striata domestica]